METRIIIIIVAIQGMAYEHEHGIVKIDGHWYGCVLEPYCAAFAGEAITD